jgi:hypothetical protein
MHSQPFLDLPLHQYEESDRNEKPRPRAGVKEVGPFCVWADGITCDDAQDQRHTPGQSNQKHSTPAGTKSIFAQQAQLTLQRIEWPATRHEEFANPLLFSSQ